MIILKASPMAWTPVAQAVDTEWFGPMSPYLMLMCPAAMFTRILGTKNGLTFFKPCIRTKNGNIIIRSGLLGCGARRK